jgi:hypothetical protein
VQHAAGDRAQAVCKKATRPETTDQRQRTEYAVDDCLAFLPLARFESALRAEMARTFETAEAE